MSNKAVINNKNGLLAGRSQQFLCFFLRRLTESVLLMTVDGHQHFGSSDYSDVVSDVACLFGNLQNHVPDTRQPELCSVQVLGKIFHQACCERTDISWSFYPSESRFRSSTAR